MGVWSTAILGNDTSLDIYQDFVTQYNNGGDPIMVSAAIVKEYAVGEQGADWDDEWINLLLGFALAEWETKCLEPKILELVRQVIESGAALDLWEGADESTLRKRSKILSQFLAQISVERAKPKRRVKEKHIFSVKELVRIIAPDGKKKFYVNEEFVNHKYIHTGGLMSWDNGNAEAGIMYYENQDKSISAHWLDNNHLEILHEPDIVFLKKEHYLIYLGSRVRVSYREFPPNIIDRLENK